MKRVVKVGNLGYFGFIKRTSKHRVYRVFGNAPAVNLSSLWALLWTKRNFPPHIMRVWGLKQ